MQKHCGCEGAWRGGGRERGKEGGEEVRQDLFTSQQDAGRRWRPALVALAVACIAASSPAAKVNRSFLLPWRCPRSALSLPWDLPWRVSEGAGEVRQSRIPPSHPASWYSRRAAGPSAAPCPLVRLPACILTHQRRLPIVISTFPLPPL